MFFYVFVDIKIMDKQRNESWKVWNKSVNSTLHCKMPLGESACQHH